MNLQELSERVQAMLDGEKKRREVALEFVQKLQNILEPVAPDLGAMVANAATPSMYGGYARTT